MHTITSERYTAWMSGHENQNRAVRYWAWNAVCELPDEDGKIVEPYVKEHLELFLGSESDYDLRYKVLAMLRIPGDYALVPWVAPLLADESLRKQAIETLIDIGDPSSAPLVQRYAEDADPKVRQAVQNFLRQVKPTPSPTKE